MINIAICDDDEIMIDKLKSKLILFFENLKIEVKIDLFINSKKFVEACKNNFYDLSFLDIYMSEFDGFEVANILQNIDSQTNIAFFTTVTDFHIAQNAFLYKPVAYIKKESIDGDLEKYKNSITAVLKNNNFYYTYTLSGQTHKIKCSDIYYLRSERNYIRIYTVDNLKYIEVKKTLKSTLDEINNENMVQINKGIIVNIPHIERIGKNFAYLSNGVMLSISSRYYKNLEEKFTQYLVE